MPYRMSCAISVIVLLSACEGSSITSDAGSSDGAPVDGGPSCTVLSYDESADTITRWPEPALVVEDGTTETGLRLAFDPERYADLARRLAGYLPVVQSDLGELDGFGINAEAFFTFDRHFDAALLPSGDETAAPESGIGFVVIEPGPARVVPVITSTTDLGRTLLLAPMRPLPARARVAAYVTRALTEAGRGCLEPSSSMRALLASPGADDADAIAALVSLGVIEGADQLVALSTFPTQSITEDSVAVAEDIATRDYALLAPPTCERDGAFQRCEASFVARTYRDPDGAYRRARGAEAEPSGEHTLAITMWLPTEGERPFPVLVYGHGLSGDRSQAERLADFAAPHGIATLAIDAVEHGEHPTTGGAPRDALSTVLDFFAINQDDLDTRALEALRLRDNFRESTWDRLQLTRLVEQHPDLDGDGSVDLDVSRVSYLGVSLGGLMGPELMALSPRYSAGVLVVPGGRVSTIISDSAMFGALITLLRPRGTSDGDVRRFFPILQTVLDRGDPASYGPWLVQGRLTGAASITPSVLVGVVLDDTVVPNVANYTLGRAIGVPIVAPLLRAEPGFEVVTGPVSGNFADGAATAGLLQFDVVGDGAGGTEPADHGNVGDSDVGAEAWLDFLRSHFDDGLARIRDPYAAIGLSHASP